jgi:ectoine hydroxylase-related dioxygenase (phytanoyl-CoA dioxygenase family)
VSEEIDRLLADGYVVVPDLADADTIGQIRDQLAPHLAQAPFGRNDFEGFRSQRLYALLGKAPAVAALVEHPRVLAILDACLQPAYLLSANIAINVHPGETTQLLHADDAYCAMPRPRAAVGVSAIWAIDEFTADNGATQIIPGSHAWASTICDANDPRVRTIEMSPGSVLVFLGTTLHRGGANRTTRTRLAITPQYCEPWIRQIENMSLAIPPPAAATLPRRVQELLGYSIYPPFIGYVDGVDPRRLLDAAVSRDGWSTTKVREHGSNSSRRCPFGSVT